MIKMFFLSVWMLIAGIKVYDGQGNAPQTGKKKADRS
jgi:hypothetical protein